MIVFWKINLMNSSFSELKTQIRFKKRFRKTIFRRINSFRKNQKYHQKIKQSVQYDVKLISQARMKNKKCSKREQERSRTQDFILVHPSSRATSSPLPTSKDLH